MSPPSDAVRVARRLLAVVVALSVAAGSLAGVAAAQETRTGGTVVVGPDETVRGDLVVTAGTLVVRGTVDGDLTAFAGDVVVAGTVTGDLEAFAGNLRVTGTVGGDLEAFAGNVALLGGGVDGRFEAAGGSVLLDGRVGAGAAVGAGTLTLGPSADVAGDVEYDAETFSSDPAARVGGEVRQVARSGVGPRLAPPRGTAAVYGFLVNLLVGVVLLAAFPRFSRSVADRVRSDPLPTGGAGLVVLVGVPILLALLLITVVGIPVALVGGLLFGVLLWVGYVYGSYSVGDWLVAMADVESRWVGLVVGLLVVALVTRVPVLGGLVSLAVVLLGVGAVAYNLGRRYDRRRRGGAAAEGTRVAS